MSADATVYFSQLHDMVPDPCGTDSTVSMIDVAGRSEAATF